MTSGRGAKKKKRGEGYFKRRWEVRWFDREKRDMRRKSEAIKVHMFC